MSSSSRLAPLCAILLCSSILVSSPAFADMDAATAKQIELMQKQIQQLQAQLDEVRKNALAANKTASRAAADATAARKVALASPAETKAAANNEGKPGGPVKITVGGFTEAAGIYRNHNMGSDIATSFGNIPYRNASASHMSEFRESARQSRLTLLAQGATEHGTDLAGYFELDFQGAANTANSKQSNSYNPRIRQIYATIDDSSGWHFLGGQAWSLITLDKEGITPRKEDAPLTIDAQYVPGFTWTRNTQFRLVRSFDDNKIAAGLSLESPQAVIYNGPNPLPAGTAFSITGGAGFYSTTAYSTDLAPDIIAKVAFDPGYGHYEVYGLARFFRDRNHASNSTIMGGGGGAAAILPIIDKKLDFQISGLIGDGIGRYGTSQLPDVTLKPDGGLATVQEVQALAGLIGHPDPQWDLYTYAGTERARKKDFASGGLGYGYGSPLYVNSGCLTEGVGTCTANSSAVSQLTAGAWWKFYNGKAGMMELGAQDSFTIRNIFKGVGGAPSTNENVTMMSFRYYPF